jgi:hypothetical protein
MLEVSIKNLSIEVATIQLWLGYALGNVQSRSRFTAEIGKSYAKAIGDDREGMPNDLHIAYVKHDRLIDFNHPQWKIFFYDPERSIRVALTKNKLIKGIKRHARERPDTFVSSLLKDNHEAYKEANHIIGYALGWEEYAEIMNDRFDG